MTAKPVNLDSIIPDDLKGSSYRFVKDLFGTVLTFNSVSFSKDDRGYKATFVCKTEAEKPEFYVTTRAIQPMKVGKYILQNKLFPMTAKFITEGQAVLLVDPDKAYQPTPPAEDMPF